MKPIPNVRGAAEVAAWFGSWPSFHDAEITRLHLNRSRPSYLEVHVFHMTSETTPTGQYRCDKHALVTFEMTDVLGMELTDFNHQNVNFGLDLTVGNESTKIVLQGCYGLQGFITARVLSIALKPGRPTDYDVT